MSRELIYAVADAAAIYPVLSQVSEMTNRGLPGGPVEIVVRRPERKRSNDQNRLLWSLLNDLSRQVQWHGLTLTPEEWKDLATAALKKHRIVPGMDGGFVMVGGHTSRMKKAEFSELLETIFAFGAENSVVWHDDAQAQWDEWRAAS